MIDQHLISIRYTYFQILFGHLADNRLAVGVFIHCMYYQDTYASAKIETETNSIVAFIKDV